MGPGGGVKLCAGRRAAYTFATMFQRIEEIYGASLKLLILLGRSRGAGKLIGNSEAADGSPENGGGGGFCCFGFLCTDTSPSRQEFSNQQPYDHPEKPGF